MTGIAAVGVHNQLSAGKAAVTGRPADAEAPCGIDEVFGLGVQHGFRNDRADDMKEDIFPELIHGYIRFVLGGNHHCVHPCRDTIPVIYCDLSFSVRQEIGQDPFPAHIGQTLCQLMGKLNGQGHQAVCFPAGIAEHHALIARTVFHGV